MHTALESAMQGWTMKFFISNVYMHQCHQLNSTRRKVKSFPSHMAHWAAVISVSVALSQTPAYTARPQTWYSFIDPGGMEG